MAFKEVTVTSASSLLTELVNFCKNTLGWSVASVSGDAFIFKSIGATFTLKAGGAVPTAEYVGSSIEIVRDGDTQKAICNTISGFDRVFFKGDSAGVMVVIKPRANDTRWFGFGTVKAFDGSNIDWCEALFIKETRPQHTNFISYAFCGFWGANSDGAHPNESTGVFVYNNIPYYTRCSSYPISSSGYRAINAYFAMNYAQNNLNNSFMISKLPIIVQNSINDPRVVIGEMPLWFITNTYGKEPFKEYMFGHKKYMLFSLGSVLPNDTVDRGNAKFMLKAGYAGFALEMD